MKNYRNALSNLLEREVFLNSLQPSSDKRKAAEQEARQATAAIAQARLQMALALVDPVSLPLLGIVVAWATCSLLRLLAAVEKPSNDIYSPRSRRAGHRVSGRSDCRSERTVFGVVPSQSGGIDRGDESHRCGCEVGDSALR
jgi:hypothetical protein